MHDGLVVQSQKFKKRVASDDTSEYKVVPRGDLVVGFPIDEGVLDFQFIFDEAIVSPAYSVWRLIKANVDASYLKRYLRSPLAITYYKGKLRSTTARRRSLSSDMFLSLPVPLPSLDEQRRIAVILEKADALRQKREQALEFYDQLGHGSFSTNFGDPLTNPKRLPVRKIGELDVEISYGPRFYNEKYSENGTPIVRITDLSPEGDLCFDEMPKLAVSASDLDKYKAISGDILFARTGATVGKIALISDSDPVCIPGAYFIRMRFPDVIDPIFAWYSLRSPTIQAAIMEGSRQSAQQNFSGPGLRRLPMLMPDIEAQRKFAEQVKRLRKHRSKYKEHSLRLSLLFSSLEHRAFTGQL
jgi:type I restriction enzyme S subunit